MHDRPDRHSDPVVIADDLHFFFGFLLCWLVLCRSAEFALLIVFGAVKLPIEAALGVIHSPLAPLGDFDLQRVKESTYFFS